MKNLLLMSAFALAGMAGAQHEEMDARKAKLSPEEQATRLTEKMTKQLDLTPEQVAQIKPQNLAFAQQQAASREQIRVLREQQKAEMEAHRKNIHAILTPEQQKKADKMMEKRKHKRKERMEKRRKMD